MTERQTAMKGRESDHDGWYGKTCREHSAATKGKTSGQSSKKRQKWPTDMPAYLELRGGQKWPSSGCIMGDGWSIAWRVHDAQFWGVPQRRKRIALVADFGGGSAPEILFERKGLSGDIEESGEERKRAAAITEGSIDKAIGGGITYDVRISSDGTKNWRAHCYETDKCRALDTGGENPDSNHGGVAVVSKCYGISAYESNAMKSSNPHSGIYEADTMRTLDLNGGRPDCNQGGVAVVQGADIYNGSITGDITATLNASSGDSPTRSGPSVICLEGNGSRPSHKGSGCAESDKMYTLNSTEVHAVCVGNGQTDNITMAEVANTLDTMHDQQAVLTYGIDRAAFNQGANAQYGFSIDEDLAQTIVAQGPGGY